jgi:hypothetical protein
MTKFILTRVGVLAALALIGVIGSAPAHAQSRYLYQNYNYPYFYGYPYVPPVIAYP